jgi:hypothetical protein
MGSGRKRYSSGTHSQFFYQRFFVRFSVILIIIAGCCSSVLVLPAQCHGIVRVDKNGSGSGRNYSAKLIPAWSLEYLQGYGFFSMNRLNKYYIDKERHYMDTAGNWKQVFDTEITGGHDIEIELNRFIGDYMQITVSYLWLRAKTENDTLAEFNGVEYDFYYLDAEFHGFCIGAKYFIVNNGAVRLFADAKSVFGKGLAHLGYGTRPEVALGAYGDDNLEGHGIGLTAGGGLMYNMLPHITIGLSSGYRLLRTEVMRNLVDGAPWLRPPVNPQNINLDFSGFFIRGLVCVEF